MAISLTLRLPGVSEGLTKMSEQGAQKKLDTKRHLTRAKFCINAWASSYWFQQSGGVGIPDLRECTFRWHLLNPDLSKISNLENRVLPDQMESHEVYDASEGKYSRGFQIANWQDATADCIAAVEHVLRATMAPGIIRPYLLCHYPVQGKFLPKRKHRDPFEEFWATHEWVIIGKLYDVQVKSGLRTVLDLMSDQVVDHLSEWLKQDAKIKFNDLDQWIFELGKRPAS